MVSTVWIIANHGRDLHPLADDMKKIQSKTLTVIAQCQQALAQTQSFAQIRQAVAHTRLTVRQTLYVSPMNQPFSLENISNHKIATL